MSKSVITWPNDEEKLEILTDFENIGFKDVLGIIDGTHVRIDTPWEDPESLYNRKNLVHVQALCDSKRKIRDVFIGFPGSVHDGRVFRNSTLCNTLEEKCGEKYILGDSAYPCLRNYKNRRPLTPMEVNFNKKVKPCACENRTHIWITETKVSTIISSKTKRHGCDLSFHKSMLYPLQFVISR
ncbi:hypothetical protein NQ314_001057 [Rhamnusium bicolor]|uniref:DDE Tnp4 domain-containing protein n=1 Tax=Rhamnusium bicolor TaxID=1586634 RepID=A0AAV8ZVA7_9CUCU|nr:hypothetical protein NQ314_001057 [Rhamnusium bicolor]